MELEKLQVGSIHKLKYGIYKSHRLKFEADSEIEIIAAGPRGFIIKACDFNDAQTLLISEAGLREALA